MKKSKKVSKAEFSETINTLKKTSDKISIIYSGWQDYHYFKELCDEDGGVIEEHLNVYNNFYKNKKLKSIENLISEAEKYQSIPVLHSKNGNKNFYYDLHIWINNHYLVYNAYKEEMVLKKMNLFDYIFHPMLDPDWSK